MIRKLIFLFFSFSVFSAHSAMKIDIYQYNSVTDINIVDRLINGALSPAGTASAQTTYVDFYDGSGGNGRFANNASFPGGYLDDFAMHATCKLVIPKDGNYTFGTSNDDGVRLKIDNNTVILDDSRHATREYYGVANLTAGVHDLDFVFFEHLGGASVELFAAEGNFGSWDNSMKLVGDTANGGLACNISTLTLLKNVINDDAGTANANDWTLQADIGGGVAEVSGVSGVFADNLQFGTYDLSELSGPAGYTLTELSCSNSNANGTNVSGVSVSNPKVTISAGDFVSCTFTNNDDSAMLSVNAPDNTLDNSPTITGKSNAIGETVTLTVVDSAGVSQTLTAVVQPDGTYSVDVSTPLAAGAYTVDASVTAAGVTANASDPGSIVVHSVSQVPSLGTWALSIMMLLLMLLAMRQKMVRMPF